MSQSPQNRNSAAEDQGRPNIVIVLADDMGYGDVRVLNPRSRIPTPHMDNLAANGVSFTDAHAASSVCTPSRYALLTGEYCWRSGLHHGVFAGYEPPLISVEKETIARLLRSVGYRTAAIGKWHLGLGYGAVKGSSLDFTRPIPWPVATREFEEQIDFAAPLSGGPLELGFDEFFGTSGCPTCQPPYGWIDGDRFIEPPDVYDESAPYTGRPGMRSASWKHSDADPIIIQHSVDFIGKQSDGEPFFLYVGLDAPHEPCIDEFVPAIARGRSQAGPRGDLVWLVDHAVGEIVAALEASGQVDNTLLIVTSDNGALPGDRVIDADGVEVYRSYDHDPSGGWRGHKAHIWEGGHREPLLIQWPNRIPPGSVCAGLVCLTDLVAMTAALAGAKIPEAAAVDSFDVSPLLANPAHLSPRTSIIHHSQRGVFAVRRDSWKAIFDSEGSGGWPPPSGGPPVEGSRGQLYHLGDDPSETRNLWDVQPDIVESLRTILDQARADGRTAPVM